MKAVKRICISLLLGVLFISTISTSVLAVGNSKPFNKVALSAKGRKTDKYGDFSSVTGLSSVQDLSDNEKVKSAIEEGTSCLKSKSEVADYLYSWLTGGDNYKLSKAAACGVIANAIQESRLNDADVSGDGKYYGLFQKEDSSLISFTGMLRISRQLKSIMEGIESNLKTYLSRDYTWEDFQKETDPELAAIAFCVAQERCVIYSDQSKLVRGTTVIGGKNADFISWGSDGAQPAAYYQQLFERRCFAWSVYQYKGGSLSDVASSANATGDGADSITDLVKLPSEGELKGMDDPDLFADYYASKVNITLGSYAQLLQSDARDGSSLAYEVRSWGEVLAYQNEALPIKTLRAVVAFAGIILILYSTILYIAYWFDRVNNLFEVSMLSILTRGRLVISPEDNYSTFSPSNSKVKTIIHRDIIWISLVGIAIGVLILTGKIYFLIGFFIDFAKSIINGFTLNK